MKRFSTHLFGVSLGLMILAATPAWAGLINPNQVDWSYTWVPDQPTIHADGSGTGGIFLTTIGTTTPTAPTRSDTSDIIATNMTVTSSAPQASPDLLNHGNYGFTLNLKDLASGQSSSLRFTGFFSGSFSASATNLTNHATSDTTESVTLGGHTYTVTFGPVNFPDPGSVGSIGAFVDVGASSGAGTGTVGGTTGGTVGNGGGNGGGDGGGGNSPEPSTLLLACLGMSSLGLASWRKRARRANG
jgi:PEP-CTERM motif-containing protein